MEHDAVCIYHDELIQTVNARWEEAMASPDIRRLYSLAYMAENLAAMIERADQIDHAVIIHSLRGIADEARSKMLEMMPKDDASAECRAL